MFTLDLEKAKEPEIKLPLSVGSSKKQASSRKTSTSALLTMPKLLTVWITTNWKILQEMGIPDHLTCLLRNMYAGQEATIRTGHGTTDWFQIRKGVHQSCILSPCLFNLCKVHYENAGLDEAQATIFLLAILIVAVITSICDRGFRMSYSIFIAFTLRDTPRHSSWALQMDRSHSPWTLTLLKRCHFQCHRGCSYSSNKLDVYLLWVIYW